MLLWCGGSPATSTERKRYTAHLSTARISTCWISSASALTSDPLKLCLAFIVFFRQMVCFIPHSLFKNRQVVVLQWTASVALPVYSDILVLNPLSLVHDIYFWLETLWRCEGLWLGRWVELRSRDISSIPPICVLSVEYCTMFLVWQDKRPVRCNFCVAWSYLARHSDPTYWAQQLPCLGASWCSHVGGIWVVLLKDLICLPLHFYLPLWQKGRTAIAVVHWIWVPLICIVV